MDIYCNKTDAQLELVDFIGFTDFLTGNLTKEELLQYFLKSGFSFAESRVIVASLVLAGAKFKDYRFNLIELD